jgi:hypothetical protein
MAPRRGTVPVATVWADELLVGRARCWMSRVNRTGIMWMLWAIHVWRVTKWTLSGLLEVVEVHIGIGGDGTMVGERFCNAALGLAGNEGAVPGTPFVEG